MLPLPSIVSAVAAVVLPAGAVLWLLIRTEMRAQILQLHLTLSDRTSHIEERVSVLENRALRSSVCDA
jgi:hypothetical protein